MLIAGGTIHNPPGIQRDISVVPGGAESAQTLHYTIRFLKGWTYGVTELFGEKLPITYGRSSPAVPWETGSDGAVLPTSESPRNAMLDIIVYAHEQKLLSWIDSKDPARQGSRKINAFISRADPVGKLAPEAAERWRNSGPSDSAEGLTSHLRRRPPCS